jgi:hypothetical protein
MSYTNQEDTSRKDQGRALLDEGPAPPVPGDDGPAIIDTTALTVDDDVGTYKTPSK